MENWCNLMGDWMRSNDEMWLLALSSQYQWWSHYRIRTFCWEPNTPGKGYFTLGKAFAGVPPGKDPPAKNWPAKISLPGAFYRAPGKDFAESKHSPRQRKVTVTAPAPSVLFFPGPVCQTPGKDFLIFFPKYSMPRAFWVGSRQMFFYFFFNNFFAGSLVPDTRLRFLFYFLTITLSGALALAPGKAGNMNLAYSQLCRVPWLGHPAKPFFIFLFLYFLILYLQT